MVFVRARAPRGRAIALVMRPLLVLFFMCALHVATGGGADAAIDTASMSTETGADGVFFALQQQSLWVPLRTHNPGARVQARHRSQS